MPAPLLTANPTAARPGAKVVVAGQYFPPHKPVRIKAADRELAKTIAGPGGAFSVAVTIPRAAPGTLTIEAASAKTVARLSFTIPPRPSAPPYARIEPRRAVIRKGSVAFFDGGYSLARARGAKIAAWSWKGPKGQTGTERAFRVTTDQLPVGRHPVTLTVTDSNHKQHTRQAILLVVKPARARPLKPAHLIQGIRVEKPQVRSGEYFRVDVTAANAANPAERVDVEIHGQWGHSRILQVKGGPGKRRLRIAARTRTLFDVRHADVEVVAGKADGSFIDFYVAADPKREHTAVFRILDPVPAGSPPRTYVWRFGDGHTATTTVGAVEHDYSTSVDGGRPFTVVEADVHSPEAGLFGGKTITRWNRALSNAPFGLHSEVPSPLPPLGPDVDQRHRMAWVLSGGGAKGAFQAGVVRYLDRIGIAPHVIAGTSVGALNAAKLAEGNPEGQHRAAERLEALWRGIEGNDDIFERSEALRNLEDEIDDLNVPDAWDILYWVATGPAGLAVDYVEELEDAVAVLGALARVRNLFDQTGLQEMVDEHLDPALVRDSGIRLRLAAVELETGALHYFTEDGAVLNRALNEIEPAGSASLRMAVLASSAIPALFKRVRILNRVYVDGAIREDVPLLAALDLNPSVVFVINTFPSRFESSQLAPLQELLGDIETPKALDFLMQSIEIIADETAQDDVREHLTINRILREVFAERDPELLGNLLVSGSAPSDPPHLAPRQLHTYPLGHRAGNIPLSVDHVVPQIRVIAPPWNLGGVTDFYRWALAAYLELGEKVAELTLSEIPGGLSVRESTCEFVLERLAECTSEFAPFSNACYVWAGWAYNYCGGPRPFPEGIHWDW
jgi:predicted acylesterase/phospholipase RssA